MKNDMELIDLALSTGADKVTIIPQHMIKFSRHFRTICATNACGKYGRCYMCPPDVGDIDQLMDTARQYLQALVYQTISSLEDSFDYEGMVKAVKKHSQFSQRLQKKLPSLLSQEFLHLTCGGCWLCDECLKSKDIPCRFPEQALPSIESYGVDMYNTIKNSNLKYINGPNTVTYFGMVFFHPEDI